MAIVIQIDARNKVVRLQESPKSGKIAQLLGPGPYQVHLLPNGDTLKIRKDSNDKCCFTIGHSVVIRGSALVIAKTSVNVSNMSLLLAAIKKMVTFPTEDNARRENIVEPVRQLDFWSA